ncbi:DUF3472 domain-containing protein [Catenulispora pinisilvae]|uniref:DUF3472 domain-containing protein n=1 Tax=Catenulispora pinisilvae TaxID=2705253 RepID=UPI0018919EEC|nr:hypothetical protein [Catenulispora pinisilvae]
MSKARLLHAGTAALTIAILTLSGNTPASAAVAGGNVSLAWSLPGVPADGVTNITFPMTVNEATQHASGTYFAAQFNFTNAPDVGYMGLQPRADSNGQERLHAAFSSFNAGTTTDDPQCSTGADGGPGVSCATDFDAVYGDVYALTVTQTGPDTWTGTATDTDTQVTEHIGTYRLPSGSGNLAGSQVGFTEDYLSVPSCAQSPRIDVFFGNPTSTDAGGLTGTIKAQYEYNGCVGQADYQATNSSDGAHVTRGYIS